MFLYLFFVRSSKKTRIQMIDYTRQRRVALQYLFVRYTCRNVVNYDGYQDTRPADTRSAVADGRVYTDSLAPVLHRFILTRFSLQRHHRRLGDLMVGLGGDPYLETVASSTLAC